LPICISAACPSPFNLQSNSLVSPPVPLPDFSHRLRRPHLHSLLMCISAAFPPSSQLQSNPLILIARPTPPSPQTFNSFRPPQPIPALSPISYLI
jgi:hypothetical protein